VTPHAARLILDTTAVAAFGRGSIHVGETIGEITDEGVAFGVPTLCLAEAVVDAKPDELVMLDVLAEHGSCLELSLTDDWRNLGLGARVYGSTSRAAVRALAIEHRAYVMTADPDVYGDLPTLGI
jgi:hypothetical protein